MILWDDFDNRLTKVMCDVCEKKVDFALERMMKSKTMNHIGGMHKRTLSFKLFGRRFYISIFDDEEPKYKSYILQGPHAVNARTGQ